MKFALFAYLLATVVGSHAAAEDKSLVGQAAPPFVAETCINRPLIYDSRKLVGEVVVLEFWGTT